MGRPNITKEDIIHILKNKEKLIMDIHDKMFLIERDITSTSDIITSVSYPKTQLSDMPHGNGRKKGLDDIYEKYLKILDERTYEKMAMIWELIMEEEKIERVWSSFLALDEPYYGIIKRLYLDNELYMVVEKESDLSHQVFEKYRKHAIEIIEKLYCSNKTDSELISLQNMRIVNKTNSTLKQKQIEQQLSLFEEDE